jgi:hypothetical protein
VVPHHDQRTSENGDPKEHGRDFFLYHASATTLLANHSDFFNTHAIYRQTPIRVCSPVCGFLKVTENAR